MVSKALVVLPSSQRDNLSQTGFITLLCVLQGSFLYLIANSYFHINLKAAGNFSFLAAVLDKILFHLSLIVIHKATFKNNCLFLVC